jgi:transcriptional regulator with XRE-family HTH domain
MTVVESNKSLNLGRNAKRIREILGIKQETVAQKLGITQQALSLIEGKEVIDNETLEKLATAMNVKKEAIENFSEESTINIISPVFNSHDSSTAVASANHSTFNSNPIEKIVELYERLLAVEKEKLAAVEKERDELRQQLKTKQ